MQRRRWKDRENREAAVLHAESKGKGEERKKRTAVRIAAK